MRHTPRPFVRRLALCSATATAAAAILAAGCSPGSGADQTYYAILEALVAGFAKGSRTYGVNRELGQIIEAIPSGASVNVTLATAASGSISRTLTVNTTVTGVRFADMDRNGLMDVIVTTNNSVTVFRQTSPTVFGSSQVVGAAGASFFVSPAVEPRDLNNDSFPDLAYAIRGDAAGVYTRLNLGDGTLGPIVGIETPGLDFTASTDVHYYIQAPYRAGMVVGSGDALYPLRFDGSRMVFLINATGVTTTDPVAARVPTACPVGNLRLSNTSRSVYYTPTTAPCGQCLYYQYGVLDNGTILDFGCSAPADEPVDSVAPADILLVDLTNDGVADLVLARPDRNEVGIRIGLASGGFGPERAFPIPGVDSLRSELLDDDTYPDILAGSTASNTTTLLFNNRNGGVYTRSTRSGRINPTSLVIADFDGDGYADALSQTPNLANSWSLYLGGPSTPGNFAETPINFSLPAPFPRLGTPALAYKPPAAISAGMRLAYPDDSTNARISLAAISVVNGVATYTPLPPIDLGLTNGPPYDIAVADLDGDGDDDFVVPTGLSDGGSVLVILQNADGSFAAPLTIRVAQSSAAFTIWARIGNFVPGGGPDIATQNGVIRNNGAGSFTPLTATVDLRTLTPPIAVGDVDGDGKDDVVGTEYDMYRQYATWVYFNTAPGRFGTREPLYESDTRSDQIRLDSGPSTTDGPGSKILSLTIPATNAINARRLRKQIILSPNGPSARPNTTEIPASLDLGTGQVIYSVLPAQGVAPYDGAPAPRSALVVASRENGPFGGLSVYPSIGRDILPCIGDATRDKRIDFADLSMVIANYGTNQPIGTKGDVSYDGRVDADDLGVILSHYGSDCPR